MSSSTRPRRPLLAVLRIAVGLALIAGVLWWLAPSLDELRGRAELDVSSLLLGLVASAIATIVTAARWKLLTERMGGTVLPYGTYVHYLALTRFLGHFSSTLVMDLVGRGVALRAAGSERGLGHLMMPLVVERILDVLLPVVMLAWVLGVHATGAVEAQWLILTVLLVAFVVVAVPGLRPLAAATMATYWWIRRRRDKQHEGTTSAPVSAPLAARVVGLSMLRYGAVVGQFWAMGAAAGVVLPALSILAAAPVAQLTAMVGVTPGGLGLQEAGWAGALSWLGHGSAEVALFVLAARVLLIVNFGLLSLLSRPLLRAR